MRPNSKTCYGFHQIRRVTDDALPNVLYHMEWSVAEHIVGDAWFTQVIETTAIVRAFRLPEGDIRNRVVHPHPALREFVRAAAERAVSNDPPHHTLADFLSSAQEAT